MSVSSQPKGFLGLHLVGVPVTVSPSWLVIFLVLMVWGWPATSQAFPGSPVLALAAALVYPVALMFSVLIHEVAHAVVGRWVKQPPTIIALTLLGGHVQFSKDAPSPFALSAVAAAGPAINIVIGAVTFFLPDALGLDGFSRSVLFAVGVTNLMLGLFNVLPGLPLDGGQIVTALIWKVTGRRGLGIVCAAWAGLLIGVLILVFAFQRMAAGNNLSMLWAAFVGWSIASAAWGTVRHAQLIDRVNKFRAVDVARPAVGAPVTSRAHVAAGHHEHGFEVIVFDDDLVIGVVDQAALGSVPPETLPDISITSVMETVPTHKPIPLDARGIDLMKELRRTGTSHWAVVDGDGIVCGVIHAVDVEKMLG